ncbi:MAG: hypothetical protein IJ468_06820 [Lachnospiraceae bacterium]|nr:hypothetical protein [Lachnospiraceae bacterium]
MNDRCFSNIKDLEQFYEIQQKGTSDGQKRIAYMQQADHVLKCSKCRRELMLYQDYCNCIERENEWRKQLIMESAIDDGMILTQLLEKEMEPGDEEEELDLVR